MKADNSAAVDEEATEQRSGDTMGEIIRTIVYALLIALLFRTVLYQPFSIPTGSMKSTLLIGDYLFVSKYSYGYSKFSLPWGSRIPSWMMSGRILSSEPKRGDVIVFRNPRDEKEDYIKRLIGLPGDRIKMIDGQLYINGAPTKVTEVKPFVEPRAEGNCNVSPPKTLLPAHLCEKSQFVETLPGGVSYRILNVAGVSTRGDNSPTATSLFAKDGEFIVPTGHYFFLGDNRDNSTDSRFDAESYPRGISMVKREYLIGRAEFILLSSHSELYKFWDWRAGRFFKAIK